MERDIAPQPSDEQSRDVLYALLSHRRRRYVCAILSERDSPVALDDLATAVAARERQSDDERSPAADRIAVSLHHVHLPKLAAHGYVDYDAETNTVAAETAALSEVPVASHDAEDSGETQ